MTRSRTPLVDVHAHFVTDDYQAAALAAGHRKPDGMPWPAWDAGQNLQLMDQWGVGTAVLSVSSPGTHFGDNAAARALSRQVNEFGAAVTRRYPGRFGHFASLPLPDVTGCLDELRYALDELGSDGVIVLTNAHGTYLGDDSFEPVWAELSRRHAVVFVHPTSPPCAEALCLGRPAPMMEFIFDTSRTVGDLLFRGVFTRHPDIEWIFTHGGGALPLLADRLELFRTVFLGGSGSGSGDATTVQAQMRRLWFDMAGTPFPHQVPALVDAFGSDRVLYGSDSCWTPAAGVTAQVASIDAASPGGPGDTSGGADWRALTCRNAARLLHRLSGARQAVGPHTQLLVTRCDAGESGIKGQMLWPDNRGGRAAHRPHAAGFSPQLPGRFGQDHPSSRAPAGRVIGPHRRRRTSRRSPATWPATAGCSGLRRLDQLRRRRAEHAGGGGLAGRFRS